MAEHTTKEDSMAVKTMGELLRDKDSNLSKQVARAEAARDDHFAEADRLVAEGMTPEQAWQHLLFGSQS